MAYEIVFKPFRIKMRFFFAFLVFDDSPVASISVVDKLYSHKSTNIKAHHIG